MATCARCARSGLFLSLDATKLCKGCSQWLGMQAANAVQVVNDSVTLINQSKNLETRLSRCDVLLKRRAHLEELERYGRKVIQDRPSVAVFLREIEAFKGKVIGNHLEKEFEAAVAKASMQATVAARVTTLTKVALEVDGYIAHPDAPATLPELKRRIEDEIVRVQLDGHLRAAEKAEFKGQKKKALDSYYEALYLLRHDDVDDGLQADQIAPIEAKVRELGGDAG